jgi:hypothetical protein
VLVAAFFSSPLFCIILIWVQFRRLSSAEDRTGRLARAFSELSVRRKPSRSPSVGQIEVVTGGDDDNPKGPLGLNLLHTVNEPVVDFIFVHGLGGGSRKTWSKSSDPYHYWPKEWLSQDPEFSHVRIHSFGYKADWNERNENSLDMHDFSLSLLGEIQSNSSIRRSQACLLILAELLTSV